ncbi:MAG: hypothetical protein RL368_781 [Pseudomonadota bacterium]
MMSDQLLMKYLLNLHAKALTGNEQDDKASLIEKLEQKIPPYVATLKDDAYHFPEYAGEPHSFWYTEWWYFNFFDERNNIAGMLTFAVFNPGNLEHLGVASLTAAVVKSGSGETSSPIIEYINLDKFSASTENANLELAGNRLIVVDKDTYRVAAKSNDGSVTLDLIYRQADEPQYFIRNQHGDYWNVSSWLNYMPSAFVDGEVSLNGEVFRIEQASGYHDHDWGMWKVYKETWNWAAVSMPQEAITFDVVFHAAFQKSSSYFRYGDLRLYLPQENFQLTQDGWVEWEHNWKYPTRMTFECIDQTGNYKVQVAWRVIDTLVLWKYPLIVFEQTAEFEGGLYERAGDDWKLVCRLQAKGFCEYTGTWLPQQLTQFPSAT